MSWSGLVAPSSSSLRRSFPPDLACCLSPSSLLTVTVYSTACLHCPKLLPSPSRLRLRLPFVFSPSFLPSKPTILSAVDFVRPATSSFICETHSQDIRLTTYPSSALSSHSFNSSIRLLLIYSIPSLFYSLLYHTQPIYFPV